MPFFDGNSKHLYQFLNPQNLITNFRKVQNACDPINVCLFDSILSKLRNRTANLISSRSGFDTWAKVKETLELFLRIKDQLIALFET